MKWDVVSRLNYRERRRKDRVTYPCFVNAMDAYLVNLFTLISTAESRCRRYRSAGSESQVKMYKIASEGRAEVWVVKETRTSDLFTRFLATRLGRDDWYALMSFARLKHVSYK